MILVSRSVLCLMVISYVNFYTISIDYAGAADFYQDSQVAEHEPKVRISNLKDLPKGKGGNWLWAILGAVAIAGGVAAIAGGSGGGGGGSDDTDDANTGSIGGSW